MQLPRRAVITGLGIVSPSGIGVSAHWAAVQAGSSPARRLDLFDTSHTAAKHAAWISDWSPQQWLPAHRLKRMDRFSQFAVVAARLAAQDAGLMETLRGNPRAGVSVGTAVGGFAQGETTHAQMLQNGAASVPPAIGVQIFPASAQGQISQDLGCTGPGVTNTNSCAAGNSAVGDALRMIQRGDADIVIAGGAEAPISPLIFKAFDNLGAMSSYDGPDPAQAYRPFHRCRSGFVMGEGAAFLVVEELSHAEARGAAVLAEILSYSITNEAFHMSSPEPTGEALQRCIRQAMQEAQLSSADIGYINPHASGTPANDVNELQQLAAIFGPSLQKVPISGTKPFTGHMLGAAGATELVTTVLALKHQWVPATLALDEPDPQITHYDLIPRQGKPHPFTGALSLSLGFGGIDTALILRRP